ncbi:hypothetical protein ACROYT_G000262 [Oculina patagonica]
MQIYTRMASYQSLIRQRAAQLFSGNHVLQTSCSKDHLPGATGQACRCPKASKIDPTDYGLCGSSSPSPEIKAVLILPAASASYVLQTSCSADDRPASRQCEFFLLPWHDLRIISLPPDRPADSTIRAILHRLDYGL